MLLLSFCCAHCSEHLIREEPTGKDPLACNHSPEISLWERLGNSSALDIESSEFSWDVLSSLHHTEHSSSSEQTEDEMNKALEVCHNLLSCQFQHPV
jgi:atypical dual specificity phosphatase